MELTDDQTIFIFMGISGTSKTNFYQKYLQDKQVINLTQDVLDSTDILEIEKLVESGYSISIDANNPTVQERKKYLEIARKYKVPAIILHFVDDND